MPQEQVQVKRMYGRGLTRTQLMRRPGALTLQPRTDGPELARSGSGCDGGRPVGDRPGEGGPVGPGASAGGHDGVSRPCPGHRAPTASVDGPIFTYHLPLCRSTTDMRYV